MVLLFLIDLELGVPEQKETVVFPWWFELQEVNNNSNNKYLLAFPYIATNITAIMLILACSAGVFFKERDHKFAVILEFAAILTWEKWVERGWGKMDENACP